jgi:hypothetical protein
MKAFLDGDLVVFRSGFAAERNVWHLKIPSQDYLGVFAYKREADEALDKLLPGKFSRVEGEDYTIWPERELEPLSHALHNARTAVEFCMQQCPVNEFDLVICLSGGGETFRHREAVTRPYKGNRKAEHRPTYEKEIRNYLIANWNCVIAEDEEADDLMGIGQTEFPDSTIITMDKDLDQVPGKKYNWIKEEHSVITPEQAHYNFHMQLLTGDSTDNIPGLPGIGPGKAAKALHGMEGPMDQLEEVCRMYQIHSGKEDWWSYLQEQGRLLYIRREPGQMWSIPEQLGFDEEPGWGESELTLETN